jgi:putative transposase
MGEIVLLPPVLIIDIYSRYVVGWLIAESESAVLAEKLLADTIAKHDIDRDQLTIGNKDSTT